MCVCLDDTHDLPHNVSSKFNCIILTYEQERVY